MPRPQPINAREPWQNCHLPLQLADDESNMAEHHESQHVQNMAPLKSDEVT